MERAMFKQFNSIALLFVALCIPAIGRADSDPNKIALQIEQKLKKSRYMETDCKHVAASGWEGFPTKRCNYNVTDEKTGQQKKDW